MLEKLPPPPPPPPNSSCRSCSELISAFATAFEFCCALRNAADVYDDDDDDNVADDRCDDDEDEEEEEDAEVRSEAGEGRLITSGVRWPDR